MLKAVDENNRRISPEKGRLGYCQLCKQPVRAYCGEININHWRHTEIQNCDSWSEGETEWHREWKKEFPDDWQELIIEKDSEKHIADIKTPNNLVLEIQNSSISSGTIKVRESFYGKMIWLINANKFKDNFRISSVVKSKLRYLEDNHRNFLYYEPDESFKLKQARVKLKDIEYELRSLDFKISNSESKLSEAKQLLKSFKSTTKKFISLDYLYSNVMNGFEVVEKTEYLKIKDNIKRHKKEIIDKQDILNKINKLENCKIDDYTDYKYIEPNQVSSTSYAKCALIERESESTFFPTILHFKSKTEFERIVRNKKYRLIVDPTEKLKKTQEEIIQIQKDIEMFLNEKYQTKEKIKSELESFLKERKKDFKRKLNSLKKKKGKLKRSLISKENQIESIKIDDSVKREEELIAIEKQHKSDRFDIMKKHKGLYNYNWKHKRKTWDFAEKKIYLDFENAIFEIINKNTLRKHTKEEFLEIVKNWK